MQTSFKVAAQPLITAIRHEHIKLFAKFTNIQPKVTEPLSGQFVVESFSGEIDSIELLLVRKETVTCQEDTLVQTSPILLLQIADGVGKCGWQIPFYLKFPQDFVVSSMVQKFFKIEFLASIIVKMGDKKHESDKIPLIVHR